MNDTLLSAAKCALAALSQNATFPADVELAKRVLRDAIRDVEIGAWMLIETDHD